MPDSDAIKTYNSGRDDCRVKRSRLLPTVTCTHARTRDHRILSRKRDQMPGGTSVTPRGFCYPGNMCLYHLQKWRVVVSSAALGDLASRRSDYCFTKLLSPTAISSTRRFTAPCSATEHAEFDSNRVKQRIESADAETLVTSRTMRNARSCARPRNQLYASHLRDNISDGFPLYFGIRSVKRGYRCVREIRQTHFGPLRRRTFRTSETHSIVVGSSFAVCDDNNNYY